MRGTDLGHSFWHRGALYMVFGDTWGRGGVEGRGWRSNTMARILLDGVEPTGGPVPRLARPPRALQFASMITDRQGRAKELLPARKVDGVEKTVIPTAGISTGTRMFLHYMSVRRWRAPGAWELNHAGLAWSDDDGHTWRKAPAPRWRGDSNFGQVALVAHGGFVHLLGVPAGRGGAVQLARVPPTAMLDPAAYQYWDGSRWLPDRTRAVTVVPGPAGELSVRWSAHLRCWLLLTYHRGRRAVVLRTAPHLTGPWSRPAEVTTAREHPRLYAPFLVPVETGGPVLFTLSRFDRYQVYLLQATLAPARR